MQNQTAKEVAVCRSRLPHLRNLVPELVFYTVCDRCARKFYEIIWGWTPIIGVEDEEEESERKKFKRKGAMTPRRKGSGSKPGEKVLKCPYGVHNSILLHLTCRTLD